MAQYIGKAPEVIQKVINRANSLLTTRKSQKKRFQEIMDAISIHEKAVVGSKFTSAGLSAVSTVLLFIPPFTIAGMAGMGAAAAVGVGATIGDLIKNKLKSEDLENEIEKSRKQEHDLEEALKELEDYYNRIPEELNVDIDIANGWEVFESIMDGLLEAGSVTLEAIATVKKVSDVARTSVSLGSAAGQVGKGVASGGAATGVSLAGAAGQAGKGVASGGAATTRLTVASVTSVASKVLGVVGVGLGVGDAIYTLVKGNPTKNSAQKCLDMVEQSVKDLESFLKRLEKKPVHKS